MRLCSLSGAHPDVHLAKKEVLLRNAIAASKELRRISLIRFDSPFESPQFWGWRVPYCIKKYFRARKQFE